MNITTANITSPEIKETSDRGRYLFGPIIDFLGLGGGSLLFLAGLALLSLYGNFEVQLAAIFFIVSSLINHPHFAHSYQIFYREFGRKIGPQTDKILRLRYIFAGIIAPIMIAGYYLTALYLGEMKWLAWSVNAMGFLVGWHYVKQGYGMLSVDSVMKKTFFTDGQKKLLIWNAYAGWIYSWVFTNHIFIERDFMGLSYFAIPLPAWLLTGSLIVMLGFLGATLLMFSRRIRTGKSLPWNGVIAYLTSIYIWRIVMQLNPLFILTIPAFHSLQYMLVVWRFQLNAEEDNARQNKPAPLGGLIGSHAAARLMWFYIIGALLGVFAFFGIPYLLVEYTSFDPATYHIMWPFIVIWVFINIHHYFLDNVMWRKGNPEVGKYLFAHRG